MVEVEAQTKTTLPIERLAYSIAEGAAASGLCGRTLVNYINDGKLKVIRKGRRILILRSELLRFLNRDSPVVHWKRNGRGKPKGKAT